LDFTSLWLYLSLIWYIFMFIQCIISFIQLWFCYLFHFNYLIINILSFYVISLILFLTSFIIILSFEFRQFPIIYFFLFFIYQYNLSILIFLVFKMKKNKRSFIRYKPNIKFVYLISTNSYLIISSFFNYS
jgi:hypothetical protein